MIPRRRREPPHVHRREASDLRGGRLAIRSRFAIEPLEPGFGYTRRQLAPPHAALVDPRRCHLVGPHRRRAARVSTIPKVTEDVTDIILNLKELVARSDLEEPTTVYLKAKGPAEVTAGDIAPPAGVEILNPDLHIATLGKGAGLEMEMTVERGSATAWPTRTRSPATRSA